MNCPACSKLILCVALLLGLTAAHAAPQISARKLGGLEIGFVEGYNVKNLANRLKMVRALLAYGAKLELRDKAGQTAFEMATSPQLKAALKIPPVPNK